MKILSRTDSRMVLKDGDATGIVFGVIFLIAAVVIGIGFLSVNQWMKWVALGAVVFGLLTLLSSYSITIDIQKANGSFSYRKKRVIGGSSTTYAVSDVLRIETRRQWEVDNVSNEKGASAPRSVLITQSVIVFKNGQELALDHQKNAQSMRIGNAPTMVSQGNEVALATQVAEFMEVPFQEIAPGMGNVSIGGPGSIQL